MIKYRTRVEVEYFIALCETGISPLNEIPAEKIDALREVVSDFSEEDAQRIKEIEKITNHDVKAVEYFLKEKFDALGLSSYKEFIHFGLTSQDINNTAFPMMWRDALHTVYIPALEKLIALLDDYAEEWKDIPMLARTHGQPASPTRLGKEINVFSYRLRIQTDTLKDPVTGKFGGATGNFNAHHVAYPISIGKICRRLPFAKSRNQREQYTTQISITINWLPVDAVKHPYHTVDLAATWHYISMEYFKQLTAGRVRRPCRIRSTDRF